MTGGWTRRGAASAVALAALVAGWFVLGGHLPYFRTATPRNLLLVSLDTVRADHVGSYRYAGARTPRIDALANAGLRFEHATTVVPLTLPAHSSLMTGTFPGWHGVRDNGGFYLDDDQLTLAEVLKQQGYRTGGFIGAFVLDRRWGIAQGFDRYFDEFDLDKFADAASMDMIQRRGADVVDRALAWLGENRDQRFFAWVHLYDAHTPYDAPAEVQSQFPRTMAGAYDAEIAYVDLQVGRLADALRADGRLSNTVIVVVGDHGEMLGEHGEATHGFFIYEAATRVPLIINGPGVPAAVIGDQVRIVDVMPTALSLLGVAVPAAVQGVDLMPLSRGEALDLVAHSESWYPRYHYGWSELRSIQDGRFKLIQAPRPELYDLADDPGEAHDRSAGDTARRDGFVRALNAFEGRTARAGADRGPRPIDSETEERLAALGYVSGHVNPKRLDQPAGGDPKDKIALYNLLKLAAGLSIEGKLDDAATAVRSALAEDPDIVEAHLVLGNIYKKMNRPEDAIAAYRAALARDDEHQNALFSLAIAYKDEGRFDEALVGFERARGLDPRNGKVLWQLADLWMRQGDPAHAEAVVRDALERQVDEPRFLLKLGEICIEQKRFDEAEQAIGRALEKKPGLVLAHFDLGLVHEGRGEIEKAIDAYQTELTGNTTAYRAAFNAAKLMQKTGRTKEAITYFRKVVEIEPAFGTGHLYLAQALFETGDLDGAERWARSGLENHPEPRLTPLGHYVLADVYEQRGRLAEAKREIAAAERLKTARQP
ncbi:MAG TPA: sulfatase-like hydrolase/transferase [Vicinamibacterales bacterium]|nr:sulfatase-like hydrolase/transferase [Vicinamibacterales bacterium]